MYRRLLDIVACPQCGDRLNLHTLSDRAPTDGGAGHDEEIHEGFLTCQGCSAAYPVIGGVPRLIRNAPSEYRDFYERHHARLQHIGVGVSEPDVRPDPEKFHRRSNESFSFQWQVYQYSDRTWFKDDLTLRRSEFLSSMDLRESELAGALVLDAGCGNGQLTASIASYGAEVVGMDLSRSIERAHANRGAAGSRTPYVHFVQGNVMEPPFRPGAFDHVHTSGVLHHTPDTNRAFISVQRLARAGGRVYVQLYRTRPAWVGVPNRIIRSITCRLPVPLLFWMCYSAAPLHAFLVRCVSRLRGEDTPLRQATRRENAVSMFDNYSPRYQYRYRPHEVQAMFTAAGLRGVKDVTLPNEMRHMVAFVGEK